VKEYEIQAGQRIRVFRRFSSSLPQRITIEAEAIDGRSPISGTIEVQGSRWLFPKPVQSVPLASEVTIGKGFWDTRFAVTVIPDQPARITVHRPRLG